MGPAYAAIASAIRLARTGDPAGARTALEMLSSQGNLPASASLAVLLAFEGEDAAAIPIAAAFLRDAAGFGDLASAAVVMARLLMRAGRATGQWDVIGAELPLHPVEPLLRHLRAQVMSRGALADPPFVRLPLDPEETRRRLFTHAATRSAQLYRERPGELARHRYMAAVTYALDDELLAHYPAAEPTLCFVEVLPYIRALLRAGRPEDAWKTVLAKLSTWTPTEPWEIAPIELVVDEQLRGLLAGERGHQVLATPRGAL
jgi:hypothetical protein